MLQLGDAIEGGAEQIVGLLLLPLSGLLYIFVQDKNEHRTALAMEGKMKANEDFLDKIIIYLATDLGGLLVISILVLFEADLHRMKEYTSGLQAQLTEATALAQGRSSDDAARRRAPGTRRVEPRNGGSTRAATPCLARLSAAPPRRQSGPLVFP